MEKSPLNDWQLLQRELERSRNESTERHSKPDFLSEIAAPRASDDKRSPKLIKFHR